ncbi:MAG: hypothetical protein WBA23_07925 [Tunicatimonas sp.]|uniref:hypothetical protein n=1 Tax=Tunicatimonas sp. TaxID=1940096 RepID=UPI003C76B4A9
MTTHKHTPEWLNEPWLNLSEICAMLTGSRERTKTAYFAQQRKGLRPWKEEELIKLEEIRRELKGKLG